jgi:glycosyltransferase involved in cell wall biosynthesis
MADVGTLAAAAVARERGIPVVFTLAPDPHAAIENLDRSQALTRSSFGTVDEGEHFWFRTRLVQRVAAEAAHLVLFPRPELEHDVRTLLGIDLAQQPPGRYSVVAEGIDLAVIDQSRAEASTESTPPALAELDDVLRGLPADRRHLPLAISVGRLNRVKGMAALVQAWADDPELQQRCNLLIVGGDLERPSGDEQQQLDQIGQALPLTEAPGRGLLLTGHRPNDTTARWLAAARSGRPGLAAPDGVYVCASVKEEFGIALLEAMATGLVVVAPASGGPATYVEEAVSGFLVDTRDQVALARGIGQALTFAATPSGRLGGERGRRMVAQSFTIQAMAAALTTVYRELAATETVRLPEVSAW